MVAAIAGCLPCPSAALNFPLTPRAEAAILHTSGTSLAGSAMVAIRYIVHSVDSAVAFYRDRLGFKVVQQFGAAMAIMEHEELRLWLAGPGASASRPMPDGRKPEPGGWNRFVIELDDLESKIAELRQAGVKFRNDIVVGPGGKQILCEDPSGNVVELFQPGG
jgi:catechol 2,3-dioxygenase-like lactoylglutathione lyase family enzyme